MLTHEPQSAINTASGQPFTFVTDGIDQALALASETAGDRSVIIAGGATTIRQYLRAGLLDELHLHLVPIVLGAGLRLFDGIDGTSIQLETEVLGTTMGTTHLCYRVAR